ncbi:MAG TPA: hypothetical protein VIK58_04230 [Caldimonas sp.]|jgi:hypothetical protein
MTLPFGVFILAVAGRPTRLSPLLENRTSSGWATPATLCASSNA